MAHPARPPTRTLDRISTFVPAPGRSLPHPDARVHPAAKLDPQHSAIPDASSSKNHSASLSPSGVPVRAHRRQGGLQGPRLARAPRPKSHPGRPRGAQTIGTGLHATMTLKRTPRVTFWTAPTECRLPRCPLRGLRATQSAPVIYMCVFMYVCMY